MIKEELKIEYYKKDKKISLKYILPLILSLIIISIGFIKINILNTKAMSPIGNTENNYEIASDTYGEEFKSFIKDNALVKIYNGEDTTFKVGEVEFRIRKENPILIKAMEIGQWVNDSVKNTYSKIFGNENKENGNSNEEELNKQIEEFIKKREMGN